MKYFTEKNQMSEEKSTEKTFSYLALGDSYTSGESVKESERWSVQLINSLKKHGVCVRDSKIIAKTSWTTDELLHALYKTKLRDKFDLVSLLIGVNNQYRGYDIQVYEKEFAELLNLIISLTGNKPEHVFVLSIPDYGVTPFVKEKGQDAKKIERELDAYNHIAHSLCNKKNIEFFEITSWSRRAKNDPSLIALDGLHPSGKMYKNWVNTCFDWVYQSLVDR